MFFVGSNNGNEVSEGTIKKYLESEHRTNSVYGLSKKGFFWGKDTTFNSKEAAEMYIKGYESKGFKVHHNISIPEGVAGKIEKEAEASTIDIEEEVKPVEEVRRKGTGRGRRKE
jgi:hypothetical protein